MTELERWRRERGLTQKELAEKSNVSLFVIRRIEDLGTDSTTIRTLRKLSNALDVPMSYFFEKGA